MHLNESPGSVHIDVPSAMTGVSRFLEQGQSVWKYSKDENLGKVQSNYYNFDYLITGDPTLHSISSSTDKGMWSGPPCRIYLAGLIYGLRMVPLRFGRIYVLKKAV